MRFLSFALALIFSFTFLESFTQTKDEEIKQSVMGFVAKASQEKIYLHLDKSSYVPRDTIWIKGYDVNATGHTPDSLSRNIYVDIFRKDKGWRLTHQTIKNEGGFAKLFFAIPDSLEVRQYEIIAYTNWMRNYSKEFFFRKDIYVGYVNPASENGIKSKKTVGDLQFFPEGGNLIAGLSNRVAFKAVNEYGRGVDVTATVVDSRNEAIAKIESSHLGMGSFVFTPQPNEQYFVTIEGRQFPLPKPMQNGYTFFVDNSRSAESIKIVAKSNSPEKDKPILLGHLRGNVVFALQSQQEGNSFSWTINNVDIPSDGIVHLTLFNGKGEPQCERLVYHDTHAPLQIRILPDKDEYQPHEKVTLSISVNDSEGAPVAGNFSLAVTDSRQVGELKNGTNIFNYLNLVSDVQALNNELKGTIEQPQYYFNSSNADAAASLDVLLMTQGWRRFIWNDVLTGAQTAPLFKNEIGISISGTALLANGKVPKPQIVSLFYTSDKRSAYGKTTTDLHGNFVFTGIDMKDSTKLFLKGENKNSRLRLTAADLPAYHPNPDSFLEFENGNEFQLSEKQKTYLADVESKRQQQSTKTLNEVVVSEKRIKARDPRKTMYEGMNTTNVPVSSTNCGTATSILQMLQGRVPGLEIDQGPLGAPTLSSSLTGAPPSKGTRINNADPLADTYLVKMRGQKSMTGIHTKVAYLVDGMVTDQSYLNSISPCSVASIDVVTSPVSMLNAQGVISILTKGGTFAQSGPSLAETMPNVLMITVMGYKTAREFYSPKYPMVDNSNARPDVRSTLYWNPTVKTNTKGKAQVTFWNSDQKTSVRVNLEGISLDGQPVFATTAYSVK